MSLSWEEPNSQQEAVLGYTYSCYSNTTIVQQETLPDPSLRSAIITGGNAGLAPYTVYTCDVAGFGNGGQGATASTSKRSAQNCESLSVAMMCINHTN